MVRRRRKRWLLRWAGTALGVLLPVIIVFSMFRAVIWDSPRLQYQISAMQGTLYFGWRPEGWSAATDAYAGEPGWTVAKYSGFEWCWWFGRGRLTTITWVEIPLYIPLGILLLLTALSWYKAIQHRVLPGHCQKCGYDLTGNTSGRCPECGEKTETRES